MEKETRQCQNCKQDFTIEADDFSFYEKIKVPAPTFCWNCRQQRRLAFRNERKFYLRDCDLCKRRIVSCASLDKKYPLYCKNCWWSDKWNATDYGMDYDFSKPFFEQWNELFNKVPHVSLFGSNSVNSEWVNEESDDKNCYLNMGGHYKDSHDCSSFGAAELCYECAHSGGAYNSKSLLFCLSNDPLNKIAINSIEYCSMSNGVDYCFGCVGLKSGKYIILNKQYTREQYEELLPKIIKHMSDMPYIDSCGRVYKYGEFFPPELSPFGYNETTAEDYIYLTKEQALDQGYVWSDFISDNKYDFSNYKIPDDIKDVKNDILEKILKCEVSGKAYKIIPMELSFYKQANLPIPRVHPNVRYKERIKQLLPIKIFNRDCDSCGKEIKTSYAPDRPEILYCESCYQKEVY